MAGTRPPIQLTVDQQVFADLARGLRKEAGSKELLKQLRRELKTIGDGYVPEFRAAAMSIPSKGLTQGQSLRAAVAQNITTTVRLSGALSGVNITAKRTKRVRNFTMAARRLNRDVGFNHPVFGRGAVKQVGKPGWFDDVAIKHKPEFRGQVMHVAEKWSIDLAQRVQART